MNRNGHYWTQVEKDQIAAAQTFAELVPPALQVLARMPKHIGQVCGPMSTGGFGDLTKNLAVFDATITNLIEKGYNIFDQMPFEKHMFRIANKTYDITQNTLLLNQFYLPLFESGYITQLYFIHGWESSNGSNWEHQQGQRLGIEIIYLAQNARDK